MTAKEAKPKKIATIMPVPGLSGNEPGRFAFTTELDELYERGWPYLRVLSDEAITPANAKRKALSALQAMDPFLPTIVPRDVARRMLLGYRHHPFDHVDAMKLSIAGEGAIDEETLRTSVEMKYGKDCKGSETYQFRMSETILLFEAFLGTELVANALVEHCVRTIEDPSLSGTPVHRIEDLTGNFRRVVPLIGWLRPRLSETVWKKLVAPLKKGNPLLPDYSATLRGLTDEVLVKEGGFGLEFAMQRGDRETVRSMLDNQKYPAWNDARAIYVAGADYLLTCKVDKLGQFPKWEQERLVAEIGTIRAPGTARVMAAMLTSRSVGALAASWLLSRRDWVGAEALPVLKKDPANAAWTSAIVLSLAGEKTVEQSSAALRKEKAKIFAELPAQMKACADDTNREHAAMRAAFAKYCEINAALGEVTPEAGFTHRLDLAWDADPKRVERWIDTAVEIA